MNNIEIIAELGINFHGDISLAKRMINKVKECGADTAKFQLYDPETLLNHMNFSAVDWVDIKKSKLSFQQIAELKEYCDKIEIEFLCSAFDIERLEWLEKLNVKRHKIASRSIYDISYLYSVEQTKKPVLISMGMIGEYNDLNESIYCTWTRLKRIKNHYFLYCISKYPTKLRDVFLDDEMFYYSNGYQGFSDHTIGITAPITAIVLGAKIIEKHFTFNKNDVGPDHKCSCDPDELKALCKFRDEFQEMNL